MTNTQLMDAVRLATQIHQNQKYGVMPYTYHLAKVAGYLATFGFQDYALQAAAWLHDSIEDSDVTRDHLAFQFGQEVADLVWAVTDGEGKNRKERKASMYAKARATPNAIALKLADRIANVQEGIDTKSKLRYMYLTEHPHFRAELYSDLAEPRIQNMWAHLDGLIAKIRESV